jgi:hypothetical protein
VQPIACLAVRREFLPCLFLSLMFLHEGSAGWKKCRESKKEATEGGAKSFRKDRRDHADSAAKNKTQSEFSPFSFS